LNSKQRFYGYVVGCGVAMVGTGVVLILLRNNEIASQWMFIFQFLQAFSTGGLSGLLIGFFLFEYCLKKYTSLQEKKKMNKNF